MQLSGICLSFGGSLLRPMNMDLNNAIVDKAKLEGATGVVLTDIRYRKKDG